MGFRYTKATREILHFISDYGFITINICADVFYKGKSNPIHQARVKLSTLYDNKVITRYKTESGEYIYQIEKKILGDHQYYITKLYSCLCRKFDVIYFKPEKNWKSCKRRSDAHIIIKNGENRIGLLVEFERFHATNKDKLDELYNSGEVQEWYKINYGVDYYPITLLVNPSGSSKLCNRETDYITICTNYRFDCLYDELNEI